MAGRISDEKRKLILADYIIEQNKETVAKKHHISSGTIRNILKENPGFTEICGQKNKQNTADVLEYMEKRSGSVKRFIDYVLEERLNPEINKEELSSLSIQQLVTVYGIVLDKAFKAKELSFKKTDEDTINQINTNMSALADILGKPVANRKIEDMR